MLQIPHLEFHVTHSCNLTCQGCTHFTNHGHVGMFDTKVLGEWFSNWNKRITPKDISILGGEPLLNKNLIEIIKLTRESWIRPENSKTRIVTNGLLVHRWDESLPRALEKYNCIIEVSVHSHDEEYLNLLKKSLDIISKWKDKYNFTLDLWEGYENWYLTYKGFGTTMVPFEDNDPQTSWNACTSKFFTNLYEGKLWKCPQITYLPLQKKKYGDSFSKKWDPYLKYVPLSPECTNEELLEFFERKEESICSMCPKNRIFFKKKNPLHPPNYYESKNKLIHNYT